MIKVPTAYKNTALRVAVFAAIAGGAASASALPAFTVNPGAVAGVTASTVTADNIIVSDYSTVSFSGASFTDSGYLAIVGYQLGSTSVSTPGLNTTYGEYISFSGMGTATPVGSGVTLGSFSSLTYNLYEYAGPAASFTATSTTATGATLLATGSLINGMVSTIGSGASLVPSADATLTFTPVDSAFFVSPSPFYGTTLTSFTNTTSEVSATATGFTITQGGGSFNFVSSVPEPSTYGLMLAGLGAVGFIARRRKI